MYFRINLSLYSMRSMQKKQIKVGIIGYGYVGKAVYEFLKDHYELLVYDVVGDHNTKEEINEQCDYAIISVPTPMKANGKCDISIVEKSIDWLKVPNIMIKSTVPPGTTEGLRNVSGKNIVFSPEYIGESTYTIPYWKGYPHPTDMKKVEFNIIGGEKKDTTKWVELFQKILGPDAIYMQTDSSTAEMVKYMVNSWGATKVTWSNEFHEICKVHNIDYKEARELLLLDKRMERMHTTVFEDKRGFGGKCFPKDVAAIVKASTDAGYKPALLAQVLASNDEFLKMNQ